MNIVWLVLIGLISGILSGMGLGGGTILIPALTILVKVPQIAAQGINLLAFIPTAIIALIIHSKNGYIQTKNLSWIIIPGIIFSMLGAVLTNYISQSITRIVFGVFLLLISAWQFVVFFVNIKNKK